MATNSEVMKQELRKSIADLKKLGSEVREDLRTAGADARRQWKRFFQPQVANVEKLAREIGEASHDAVARTSAAFAAFQASVKRAKKAPAPKARRSTPAKRAH